MWIHFVVVIVSSVVHGDTASKTGTDTNAASNAKDQIMNNIPAVSAFSVKQANIPTVTSFTDELQYPGIRGGQDISQNIPPTLIIVSKLYYYQRLLNVLLSRYGLFMLYAKIFS